MARTQLHSVWLVGALLAGAGCTHPALSPPFSASSTAIPPTASAFEPEIARFEAADRGRPPLPGGIVFVGSSSIRLWPDLAGDFPGEPVLNRGFGGSTLADVTYFAPRIVLPYRPRMIVLYAGDNDVAMGHTPEQVLADYLAFVRVVRRVLPTTRIVFISIKPSPSRWNVAERMREANALIAQAVKRDSLTTFVDVFTLMLDAAGHPQPELYQADSLHMAPAGYALWRTRLAPVVR